MTIETVTSLIVLVACLWAIRVATLGTWTALKRWAISRFVFGAGTVNIAVALLAWMRHNSFALRMSFVSGVSLMLFANWAVWMNSPSRQRIDKRDKGPEDRRDR